MIVSTVFFEFFLILFCAKNSINAIIKTVMKMGKYDELKNMIDGAKNIVVFTGAGISVPSGIPDFRSSNGIYNQQYKVNIPPEEIISHSFFMQNTKDFFEFYKEKMVYRDALPNKAHLFFASLEKKHEVRIVTQNIDGLHQKAGSSIVYELHGSTLRNYCMKCNKFYDAYSIYNDIIPKCNCGGIIKPDVVLYEESLNDYVLRSAIRAIEAADMLIVVGTSLIVQPAASLVRYYYGRKLVIINKEQTTYDKYANIAINDDIVNVVNELEK